MSSDTKQVKVDNWGIYFLQRLKHFFNRTDYCDLTLQFQNNAQLKVHRLVLSACTEYFELLERTCEMYEDCLVMPDDLQADVVVPIINFMYTGQLEFKFDLLDRLLLTSQIMNMPVLTKLLEAHRNQSRKVPTTTTITTPTSGYTGIKRYSKPNPVKSVQGKQINSAPSGKVQENNIVYREKKIYLPTKPSAQSYIPPIPLDSSLYNKKLVLADPRPTRYELPEELDTDNVFDNSFSNISYTSKPLMVHPETTKRYSGKRSSSGIFSEPSSSKKFAGDTGTVDIVECKKVSNDSSSFFNDELCGSIVDESDMFPSTILKEDSQSTPNDLFDQILDTTTAKVTIEKDPKQPSNLDHAKIISEVLKKYPHLIKGNKNIKLKIFNTPDKSKKQLGTAPIQQEQIIKTKTEPDFTYESDVLDSKEAAKLIAMGAENVKGPWICLICGTPGRALHFSSYYKFRRHLVEVHHEKPVSNICEYCGLKSFKRNYLLHHLYSKHGIPPPPQYNFPKCNLCSYIALTEAYLVKHKMSHTEKRNFRCNVCAASFGTSNQLLVHIQTTGHKFSADRKINLQCIYCQKVFLRESNLYAHLKTNHKEAAKSDGIVDDSDDEKTTTTKKTTSVEIKYEVPVNYESENEDNDTQYVQLTRKKSHASPKQKILNAGLNTPINTTPKMKSVQNNPPRNEFLEEEPVASVSNESEEIVMIDNDEYIVRDNQLIPRNAKSADNSQYILPNMLPDENNEALQAMMPTTSMGYTEIQNTTIQDNSKVILKKSSNINQSIQFVVSNEEEYKALMTSNHSIIFDNADANKTLTVLTAPHNPPLDTNTIDLDNAQSNDMMIIQDDYSLSVSEAVPANNSNIVVVYSHPVDTQNKQYQLITPQSIGAQYVQSSSVITQNYETVTTSNSVMNANVIENHIEESWQNNSQPNVNKETHVITNPNLQALAAITPVELAEITPIQNENHENLNELPEVHLASNPAENVSVQANTANEILNQDIIQSENTDQNVEHVAIEDVTTTQLTNMDIHIPAEAVIVKETVIVTSNENQEDRVETPLSNKINTEISNENEVTITESSSLEREISEEIIETESHGHEMCEILPSTKEEQTPEPIEQMETSELPSETNDTEQVACLEVAKEQIQELTSEWSEDEYEVQQPRQDPINCVNNIETSVEALVENTPEIEESIENIQQEIEGQLTKPCGETDGVTDYADAEMNEENLNSLQRDKVSNEQEHQLISNCERTD